MQFSKESVWFGIKMNRSDLVLNSINWLRILLTVNEQKWAASVNGNFWITIDVVDSSDDGRTQVDMEANLLISIS